jgi:hypothetical protein
MTRCSEGRKGILRRIKYILVIRSMLYIGLNKYSSRRFVDRKLENR